MPPAAEEIIKKLRLQTAPLRFRLAGAALKDWVKRRSARGEPQWRG